MRKALKIVAILLLSLCYINASAQSYIEDSSGNSITIKDWKGYFMSREGFFFPKSFNPITGHDSTAMGWFDPITKHLFYNDGTIRQELATSLDVSDSIVGKVKYTDTATMLLPYLHKGDSNLYRTIYNNVFTNITLPNTIHSTNAPDSGIVIGATSRMLRTIAPPLKITDTGTLTTTPFQLADTATVLRNFNALTYVSKVGKLDSFKSVNGDTVVLGNIYGNSEDSTHPGLLNPTTVQRINTSKIFMDSTAINENAIPANPLDVSSRMDSLNSIARFRQQGAAGGIIYTYLIGGIQIPTGLNVFHIGKNASFTLLENSNHGFIFNTNVTSTPGSGNQICTLGDVSGTGTVVGSHFTGYLQTGGWSTSNRPSSPGLAMFGWDSTLSTMEYYNGTSWIVYPGSAGGSGTVTSITPGWGTTPNTPITTTGTINVDSTKVVPLIDSNRYFVTPYLTTLNLKDTSAILRGLISGSGTVTNFSAGTLSPLFTTSVATSTTTPALTFTQSTAAANTVYGNHTGSTAAPTFGQVVGADIATNTLTYSNFPTIPTGNLIGSASGVTASPSNVTMGSGITLSTSGVLSATGTGGTITSITPGYGFNSNTPITSIGTLTIDTTKILNKIVIAPVITSGSDSTPTPLYFHGDTLYSYIATSNHDGWLTNTSQTVTGQKTFTSATTVLGLTTTGLTSSNCSIIQSGAVNPLTLEANSGGAGTTTNYGIGLASLNGNTGVMTYASGFTSGQYDEVRISKDSLKGVTGTTKLVALDIPTVLNQAAAATGDVSFLMINPNDRLGFHGTNELLIDGEADSVKKFTVTTGGTVKIAGNDTTLGTTNAFTPASTSTGDSLLGKNSIGNIVSIARTIGITDTLITASVTAKPYYRYYVNSSSLITITLPSTIAIFQPIQVIDIGTGGWKISQNAGQTMHSGSSANTTTGTAGYIQSQTQYSCVSLRAISTTDLVIDNSQGSPLFN